MDRDLAKYAALLQSARAEHERGDLRNAYSSYLKAHAMITRILNAHVVFRDLDSLENLPDNYIQLFEHAQEILRRTRDIVEQARANMKKKPVAASSTTSVTASTASGSLSPAGVSSPKAFTRGLTRPELKKSLSSQSQRTIRTTTSIDKRTKRNIPMIPISPLTKQYLAHTYALTQVTQRFEQAKQDSSPHGSPSLSGPRDLANLRRLIEDVRIQRAKVDAVNIQIHSVASANITSWEPDVVAKQITIIDTLLFKEVAIPRDLVRPDRKLGPAQYPIDFENYIAHSVAHILLQAWNTLRQSVTASSSSASSSRNGPPNAITHMIRVAQILLHVYRNFNGFMGIMRALTSPEIKRMHKLWSGVNSKTKDAFRRLVDISRNEQGHLHGYLDTLMKKLGAFQDVGKDALVAIPWMRFHQDEVKSIINSYLTGHESKDGSSDVVLSAPGARKLSVVTATLLQCRTNESNTFDRSDIQDKPAQTSNSKNREPVAIDGLKSPLAPVWDLASLGSGDASLHHWILSRPYLNKQQLIDESLEIEPLFHGEELPCYDAMPEDGDDDNSSELSFVANGENQDEHAHDDSFEHIIAPEHDLEPLPSSPALVGTKDKRPAISRSPVSESEINAIMSELLDDDSTDNGLFDDDDAEDGQSTEDVVREPANERLNQLKGSAGRTRDVLQFLGIDPDEYSGSEDDDENDASDGGFKASTAQKGKGKKLEQDDTEEIDDLLAKVKGLVHESRTHSDHLEQEQEQKQEQILDPFEELKNNDSQLLDEDAEPGPIRTFEPMQQGSEEDELLFNDGPVPTLAQTPVETPVTPMPFVTSLESLRDQLRNLDDKVHLESQSNAQSDHDDTSDKDKHSAANSSTNGTTVNNNDNSDSHQEQSCTEAGKQDTLEVSSPPTSSLPVSQGSPQSPLANPFAPFIIRKKSADASDTGSLGSSPPPTISKGRRRKIHTDRSKQSPELSTSPRSDRSSLALSPPKILFSAPPTGDLSKDDMAAVEARAKMSLAGFLTKTTKTASTPS
ncbi:hypothetical protein BG004_005604, partial [Podila humilis]